MAHSKGAIYFRCFNILTAKTWHWIFTLNKGTERNRQRKTTWIGSGWTASHILWSLLNGLLGREEERVWSRSTLYIAAGTLQMWSQTTLLEYVHEFTGHVSAQMALPAFLHPNIQSQHEAKGKTPSNPPQLAFHSKLNWHHDTNGPYHTFAGPRFPDYIFY